MKKLLLASSALLVVACTPAAPVEDHSMHSEPSSAGSGAAASVADRLSDSPRHQEWVTVKNGSKNIRTFVVYPERNDPAPVVVVIHENRGLNDWARGMADQLAEAGYIAVAPDLLSEFDPAHADTSSFASDDERTQAIMKLDPVQVQSDLHAVADWADTLPASNGKMASAGFCWGGSQSFSMAASTDNLDVALVFYGTGPTNTDAYANVSAPVYGFYAGNDARVNATIPASTNAMADAGKTYDIVMYDGAGHAFMRSGEDPNGDPANVAARSAAWERMKQVLATL